MRQDRFVGLMSGTSLDGVDAALLRFTGESIALEHAYCHPLPGALANQLRQCIQEGRADLADLTCLDAALGEAFGDAVTGLLAHSGAALRDIRAIGSHGQTLWHAPRGARPATLQIGDPNRIVAATGLPVVADFRRRDMAFGGQGAPLAPAFHTAAFGAAEEIRAVLNIGGMANLSLLGHGHTHGYDTGPGNVLMDDWIRARRGQDYDRDGAWAASGTPIPELVDRMLEDPWFQRPPPKSTGREDFHREWLSRHLGGDEADQDVQASLLALTVETIAREVEASDAQRVLVCGGGARNRALMQALAERMTPVPVEDTSAYGIAPEWVEAAAFAWLARETLAGRPGNLPAVTGASQAVVLGGTWEP